MVDVPISHVEESLKLTSDAFMDLWKVQLYGTSTIMCFTDSEQFTWQGDVYETTQYELSGDGTATDGGEKRPTLTVFNPGGVFNTFVKSGVLDRATVMRYRLLRYHALANIPIFQRRMWYNTHLTNIISGKAFTMNLRNLGEGPTFVVPARAYYPPEFPSVSL